MKEYEKHVPVRLSHLLRHCSVGAVVRGPDYLMTVKDIRNWTDGKGVVAGRLIPYVDGVRAALGITEWLREPPVSGEVGYGRLNGVCIPAKIFPSWMRCSNPRCGLLYYRPWVSQTDATPRCLYCEKEAPLEQVPWILVHPDGHMNDVPWHYLAHGEASRLDQKRCKADTAAPYLRLVEKGTYHRTLRCDRCQAARAFSSGIRLPFGNTHRQPWLYDPPETLACADAEENELAHVLEVNDVRVHSATTRNALVIPPESRIRKGAVVDRLYQSSLKRRQLELARTPLAEKGTLRRIAAEFRCTIGEIEYAWSEINRGYPLYGKNFTPGLLLECEYQALLQEIPDLSEDEDFVTRHHTQAWKRKGMDPSMSSRSHKLIRLVSRLVSVDRLKEIQVLKGFQRLGGSVVPPDIVGQSDWLPAIELYGEGIFFTLEEEILADWERRPAVRMRAENLRRRYEETVCSSSPEQEGTEGAQDRCKGIVVPSSPDIQVSPRFLLLHILAHLLIRQLEAVAGYPAASLRERIYCAAGDAPMAGILVYVAVPDVVGSLGGLAESTGPQPFLSLLSGVFDHAEWCSLDPVCGEQTGQGPGLLNRAACHACALIPEPSCAYGNILLDRKWIKGDPATGIPALLDCI